MGGVFHEAAASLGLKEASAIQVPEIWEKKKKNHELPLSNMQSVEQDTGIIGYPCTCD